MEELSPDQAVVQDENRGNFIHTYTGRRFFVDDIRPEDIHVADIAHALAFQCRFNGHTPHYYSVAQHSCLVAHHVAKSEQLWALLHDAGEAYVPDVPRPFKPSLQGFKDLEERILRPVVKRFGLTWPVPDSVHYVDTHIVAAEANRLWNPRPSWTQHFHPIDLPRMFECWGPQEAEVRWLNAFVNVSNIAGDVADAMEALKEARARYRALPPRPVGYPQLPTI